MSYKGYLTVRTFEMSSENMTIYKETYENIPFVEFAVTETPNIQSLETMDDADIGFAVSQVHNSHYIYLILTPVTSHQAVTGTMAMKKAAREKTRMHIFVTFEKTSGRKSAGAMAITDADATVNNIFTTSDSTVVTFNLPVAHAYRGASKNHRIIPINTKSMD